MLKTGLAIIVLAASTLAGGACGGKAGGGAGTPEEVGKQLIAAVNAGDAAAVRAVYPSKEALAAALDCKEGEGPWPKVERELGKMEKELAEMKGMSLEFVGLDPEKNKEQKLAVGEEQKGCKAKTEVTMLRTRFKLKMSKDGKTEEESEGVTLIQLAGSWYLLDM